MEFNGDYTVYRPFLVTYDIAKETFSDPLVAWKNCPGALPCNIWSLVMDASREHLYVGGRTKEGTTVGMYDVVSRTWNIMPGLYDDTYQYVVYALALIGDPSNQVLLAGGDFDSAGPGIAYFAPNPTPSPTPTQSPPASPSSKPRPSATPSSSPAAGVDPLGDPLLGAALAGSLLTALYLLYGD